MIQFSTASQESVSNGIKCMVYADSGLGKTVLCATLPKPVLISAESGSLSLRRANLERLFGVNNPTITYDMPIIKITSVEDLQAAYAWCGTQQAAAFQSVALDSISEMAEVILNNAKRQVKDPRQAYGELIEKMETTVRAFRDLPNKHVLVVAKQEPMKDEMTGVVKYGPAMPGAKLGNKLPYFFDEVFRLGVNKTPQGESYRFLQTQPDLQFVAKDRSGALAAMEPPHLTQLFNKILGA